MTSMNRCDNWDHRKPHETIVVAEYRITTINTESKYAVRDSKDYCHGCLRQALSTYSTGGIHPHKAYTIERIDQ